MMGMSIYEAFEQMIKDTIPSQQLGQASKQLMELQESLLKEAQTNNRFAGVVKKITRRAVQGEDLKMCRTLRHC